MVPTMWQDRDDLQMAKVYAEFRRYTNFTKWAMKPVDERTPKSRIRISNITNFDLLLNYGYSKSEIAIITVYQDSLLPEEKKKRNL